MKKFISVIVIMVIATPIFAQSGTVKVTITGIENTKGTIVIGIFDSKSIFPSIGKEVLRADIKPAKTGSISYTFENLPNGSYAIAVLHDENGNQKLDTSMMKPKEKHGFSNNVYGAFGPPNFDKASFQVIAGEVVELTINL